jgi:uncharacterized FlaG/YvyC family protein
MRSPLYPADTAYELVKRDQAFIESFNTNYKTSLNEKSFTFIIQVLEKHSGKFNKISC